jgi:hypothetical protein
MERSLGNTWRNFHVVGACRLAAEWGRHCVHDVHVPSRRDHGSVRVNVTAEEASGSAVESSCGEGTTKHRPIR